MTQPGSSCASVDRAASLATNAEVNSSAASLPWRLGKLALEFDVIVGRAGDIARSAGACADEVDRLVHRGENLGMLAHAEVVVRAPYRDGVCGIALEHVCLGERAAAALYIGEYPIAALAFDGFDRFGELLLIVHEKLLLPGATASLFCTFYCAAARQEPVPFRRAEHESSVTLLNLITKPGVLRQIKRVEARWHARRHDPMSPAKAAPLLARLVSC